MNNVYYFTADLDEKTKTPDGVYRIKYNGKDLILKYKRISFTAISFSDALSIISEDEIVSLTKNPTPVNTIS